MLFSRGYITDASVFYFKQCTDDKVTDCDRLEMVAKLAMASGVTGMYRGQVLDLNAEDHQVNLEQLKHIYHYKTEALIRAAVGLRALSAGESGRSVLSILDQYTESIGLVFQVHDDF